MANEWNKSPPGKRGSGPLPYGRRATDRPTDPSKYNDATILTTDQGELRRLHDTDVPGLDQDEIREVHEWMVRREIRRRRWERIGSWSAKIASAVIGGLLLSWLGTGIVPVPIKKLAMWLVSFIHEWTTP